MNERFDRMGRCIRDMTANHGDAVQVFRVLIGKSKVQMDVRCLVVQAYHAAAADNFKVTAKYERRLFLPGGNIGFDKRNLAQPTEHVDDCCGNVMRRCNFSQRLVQIGAIA